MTPPSSVSRSAASLLASRLAVAGIALLFLGVSTRLLTIEQMAVFAVYNTLCGLLTVVCSLGMLASCLKQVPGLRAEGRADRAARLISGSLTIYVAGAAIAGILLWLAAEPIGRLMLKRPGFGGDVRAAVLAALCFGLYEAAQLLLASLQRFGRQSRDNVAAALVQRLLSLGLFFPFGLKGYLAGFALGSLAGALSGGRAIWSFLREHSGERPRPREIGADVAYASPLYVDGYFRYTYMQADQLLVGIFLGPAELSIYFVAKRFLAYGQLLVSSLVDPLVARVSERAGDAQAVGRTFDTSLRWMVLVFVPLAALLAAVSPLLLRIVGGERYAGGALPLALLMLSLPVYALFAQAGAFVYALGRPRDRLLANFISASVQAGAMLALAPWLGLAGLAASRLAGFGAGFAGALRLARGHLGEAHPGPTLRRASRIVLPSAAAAALAAAVPWAWPGTLPAALAAAGAAALCAVWCLRWIVDDADRASLAGLVPGQGSGSRRLRAALAGAPADAGDAPI
jgi:O-antigen/teichoic acid export membrane protein